MNECEHKNLYYGVCENCGAIVNPKARK